MKGLSSTRGVLLGAALLFTLPRLTLAQQGEVPAEARYQAVARALEPWIEKERVQKGIPAISVALVDGQRIVWAKGFGWADSAAGVRASASTVFRVGSISKLFT